MAATTPKKKFARKAEKQYQWVTFTSELFEDEFVFPDQKHFDVDTVDALNSGDVGQIKRWLAAAGAEEDAVDAVGTLDTEEFKEFVKAWGKASKVPAPKSQG
jgi:hypothetical protein